MLHLIYSTPILGIILHLNHVMLFSCFHDRTMFEPISCTFCVLILSFCVSCLDLKLSLLLSWLVHVLKNSYFFNSFCACDRKVENEECYWFWFIGLTSLYMDGIMKLEHTIKMQLMVKLRYMFWSNGSQTFKTNLKSLLIL
jgi:hypothetical protein